MFKHIIIIHLFITITINDLQINITFILRSVMKIKNVVLILIQK